MKRLPCVVYKGLLKADTYLYVERAEDFSRVPDALLAQLGDLEAVLEVELHAERALARADVTEVMRALREQGYYLQLPPRDELGMPVSYGSGPCSAG
jgi:uncharacterized protein YcgL (UPF0745 family)